jgi:hypothetical protein
LRGSLTFEGPAVDAFVVDGEAAGVPEGAGNMGDGAAILEYRFDALVVDFLVVL